VCGGQPRTLLDIIGREKEETNQKPREWEKENEKERVYWDRKIASKGIQFVHPGWVGGWILLL
jgi:hypothetical protein